MSAPLVVRTEDAEESRLAQVDAEFIDCYGPDCTRWKPGQVKRYLAAIDAVHAEFASGAVAS